jgi:bacillithiol biosynthesis deacetylase BshB1
LSSREAEVDVLAVGAHPDDVELGCGATLALLAGAGRRVGVVHLTRGEAGTRGTPELRREEAERAADILGVLSLDLLDCGDGGLRRGAAEEEALIEVLRRRRPALVLAPPPRDRHPDHVRAHRLVVDACFYAGLGRRAPGRGEPHRPGLVLCYRLHDSLAASLVVDVSATWETKRRALAAYRSQLHAGGSSSPPEVAGKAADEHGPSTRVSSPAFVAAVEGHARWCGQLIGVDYGEAFWSERPLAVRDLLSLVPPGLP